MHSVTMPKRPKRLVQGFVSLIRFVLFRSIKKLNVHMP